MSTQNWQQRMLASTRGRVISLLRQGPRTVSELAASLGVTDNAVRTHLSALERDGLVRQEGVRRAVGKPAYVYRLTGDEEALFPKAYATLLGSVLAKVRQDRGEEGLERLLREVGVETAAGVGAKGGPLRQRVDTAVAVLTSLGGLAEVQEEPDAFLIKGYSCPIGAVVERNPEMCALAEELIAGIVGTEVRECCDRSDVPRCVFRVNKS